MKLTLDLEKMLDTMNKEQILKQIETEIDRVERVNKAYIRARERVSLGKYDTADLETLKAHLNQRVGDEFEQRVVKELNLKAQTPASAVPKARPVAIKDEEVADILKSLFGGTGII